MSAILNFSLTPEEIAEKARACHQDFLATTCFILPRNDGEALRACSILKALAAPFVHVSRQGWGATLDRELPLMNWPSREKIKRVLIFEMPGQGVGGRIPAEELVVGKGLELLVVDHHFYRWVDRSHPLSSLEQLCQWIGWPLSPVDQAIAVNDRSYIPGLKKLGLSRAAMLAVRHYDLEAQGFTRSYIARQMALVPQALRELEAEKKGELWFLTNLTVDRVFLLQELALRASDGVAHTLELRGNKLSFSGSPQVVQHLRRLDYRQFGFQAGYSCYAGGDPNTSQFWGFRPKYPTEVLSSQFLAFIFAEIGQFLSL